MTAPTTKTLINADRLLQTVWLDPQSRPSLRWLRMQTAKKTIPHVRIGRLVFFDAEQVSATLTKRTVGGKDAK